jgi:hypothetical protein
LSTANALTAPSSSSSSTKAAGSKPASYRRGSFGTPVASSVRYRYSPEGDLVENDDSERGTTISQVDPAHRLDSMRTTRDAEHSYQLDVPATFALTRQRQHPHRLRLRP